VRPAAYATPVKTRILAGGVHSAKQQVVRIDRITNGAPDGALRRAFATALDRAIDGVDAILVSDYGSGLVTPALVDRIRRRAWRRAPQPRAHSRGLALRRARLPQRDHLHAERVGGRTDARRPHRRRPRGAGARRPRDAGAAGHAGAAHHPWRTRHGALRAGLPTRHIPIFGSDEVADVTGAGDTVIATMTLALAAGASFYDAARLANYAGGLVVMKRGTATVPADELRAAVVRDLRPQRLARPDRRRASYCAPFRRGVTTWDVERVAAA
jgi:D-glycero-beta-D-manno-heptose-7-phosphate kinase